MTSSTVVKLKSQLDTRKGKEGREGSFGQKESILIFKFPKLVYFLLEEVKIRESI